jgi:ribosomal protein S18 acetylase RimI-like enzyme
MSEHATSEPGAPKRADTAGEVQSDLVLRSARPEEYGLVGELTVAVYVGGGFTAPDSSYVAVLRDAATRAEQAELLVAELGGTVVGTVTYCRGGGAYANIAGPEDAEFRMLGVVPAARGNGIAWALVRLCIDKAWAAGCRALRLSTQTDMLMAHRLYERMGFVRTPERDWRPGPEALGDLLITYALDLDAEAVTAAGDRGTVRGRR